MYEYIHALCWLVSKSVENSQNYFGTINQTQTHTHVQQLFNLKTESQCFWDPNTDTSTTVEVQGTLSHEQPSQLWEHIKNGHSTGELIASYLG